MVAEAEGGTAGWILSALSAAVVFVGAGIGGVLRWQMGLAAARWFGPAFPWGTLLVNISGSTLMGALAALLASRADAGEWQAARLLLMTGVLGGYTTFSAYSLDTIALWERGQYAAAAGYCVGSVVLSLAGLIAGLAVARSLP